ncbi:MAG: tripartite tricarboxylate transporter substrate binding protein [Peptococcaceae bacterium]
MKHSYWIYFSLAVIVSVVLNIGGCFVQKPEQPSNAEDIFPAKPIQVVVGWGQGGGSDIFARAITKPVADKFDIPIVVKNMPGVSATLPGDYLVNQPADGYTIWALTTTYTINNVLDITPYKLDQFIPLARIQHDTHAIQVSKNGSFTDIDQVVEYAQEHPGQLKIGGSGSPMYHGREGPGFDEVVVTLFEEAAGIDFDYVPFEDAGEMHNALLQGDIDLIVEEFGPTINYIKEEQIVPILAFSDKKVEDFPGLPISLDKGWDVTLGIWRGLFLKAGTPQDRVKILKEAFEEAYDDPGYKETERLRYWNLRSEFLGPREFKDYLEDELQIYETILTKLGYINKKTGSL